MNAPTIDRLLRYFDRGHMNPSAPTERIKKAMEPLFKTLSSLAPLNENSEAKAIWLRIPRGEISDYGSFDEFKDYGEVETYEEFETQWKENYPEEYCWYELVIVEDFNKDGKLRYRGVRLGDETIISAMMNEKPVGQSFTEDAAVSLCGLLTEAAEEAMEKLRAGIYNKEVNEQLPFSLRTGVIRRSVLWERDPGTSRQFPKV